MGALRTWLVNVGDGCPGVGTRRFQGPGVWEVLDPVVEEWATRAIQAGDKQLLLVSSPEPPQLVRTRPAGPLRPDDLRLPSGGRFKVAGPALNLTPAPADEEPDGWTCRLCPAEEAETFPTRSAWELHARFDHGRVDMAWRDHRGRPLVDRILDEPELAEHPDDWEPALTPDP